MLGLPHVDHLAVWTEHAVYARSVLGEIGAEANEATPALIDALSDNDVGVREAARQSLDLIEAARRAEAGNPTEPQAFVTGQ